MAITEFLIKLQEAGIENGYFKLVEIKNLDKSCCLNAKTQVIDFDAVKDKYVANAKIQPTPKSCDGLKILPQYERLDFIEMKSFRQFIKHSRQKSNVLKLKEDIDNKITDFNFLTKIEDSLTILSILFQQPSFSIDNTSQESFIKTKKRLVILTDIEERENAIEFIAINLLYLANYSTSLERQIHHSINTTLSAIPNDIAANFEKPILLTCGQIDVFYH